MSSGHLALDAGVAFLATALVVLIAAFAVGFTAICGVRLGDRFMDRLAERRAQRRQLVGLDEAYERLCEE